jgi:hypothetical protein
MFLESDVIKGEVGVTLSERSIIPFLSGFCLQQNTDLDAVFLASSTNDLPYHKSNCKNPEILQLEPVWHESRFLPQADAATID